MTANAAASLVAGGLAVLESIFGSQLTSKELVSRLLSTASETFDLDGTAGNDYVNISGGLTKEQQYGVGLMDLEAASAPIMGSSSEETFVEQSSDGRERVKYCDIVGLRIILSGDLCSDDHIQIIDDEGNLIVDAIGNLRFGMGFGDALGGIAFFDAFDTAWKVDMPSNPYAGALDFARIVVAPVETRFDIEDRFYAMRYGSKPEPTQRVALSHNVFDA